MIFIAFIFHHIHHVYLPVLTPAGRNCIAQLRFVFAFGLGVFFPGLGLIQFCPYGFGHQLRIECSFMTGIAIFRFRKIRPNTLSNKLLIRAPSSAIIVNNKLRVFFSKACTDPINYYP